MNLPINIFYWCLAMLPILLLLILMVKFQWGASKAAPVTLVLTILISMLFYKANLTVIGIEILKALWNSFSIILVILTAILLYEVSNEAKSFKVLNKTFEKLAPNELLRIMGIGIAFASFLQGVTGFGVPVLVTAPLLIGIGVSPIWAVIIPLIGHSWAGTFGTLAIAWNSMIMQTGIKDISMINSIALYASVLLFILNFLASGAIAYFYGGLKGLKKGLVAIVLISISQGVGQIIFSQINADLAVFIPSSISLVILILLSKSPLYRDSWQVTDSKIMLKREKTSEAADEDNMTIHDAFMPYYLMTSITLIVLLVSPINKLLSKFSYGPSFIQTETGFGVVNKMVTQFSPIKPFTHASMFLLASALLGYIYYLNKSLVKKSSFNNVLKRTIKKALPSSFAVVSLISMSKVMAGTGQTEVLAQGVSIVLGNYYVVISPFIGLLGSFMTGSNMSSNILFGDFQMKTAQIVGLNTSAILGAQTAGGGIGTSIAPGNIVLGTTTAEILGSEGKVLKKIIPFALAVACIFGFLLYIYHLLLN
ncbi:L-lactate permease [Brassicibacter mesophilus]|uniref:L-lactate permease n=1 Tax=Brassicibacter mesophilus TaxID=745119 RepID=UPI003D1A91A8